MLVLASKRRISKVLDLPYSVTHSKRCLCHFAFALEFVIKTQNPICLGAMLGGFSIPSLIDLMGGDEEEKPLCSSLALEIVFKENLPS